MSAPTLHRPGTTPAEPHPGPAEVLAALAQFATRESLASIDKQIDEAYRASLEAHDAEPLRRVLDRWWRVVLVNRGALDPGEARGPEQLAEALARRGAND